MFSNSSKYALNAMLYLSQHSSESNKINVAHISEAIAAPAPYISKLLQELTRRKLVSSTKGPRGGFYLSEENRKGTLLDIVEIVEGEDRFDSCVLGFKTCNPDNPCVIHHSIASYKNKIIQELRSKSLNQLSKEIIKGHFEFPIK
jgi:Rrf2 family protein